MKAQYQPASRQVYHDRNSNDPCVSLGEGEGVARVLAARGYITNRTSPAEREKTFNFIQSCSSDIDVALECVAYQEGACQ